MHTQVVKSIKQVIQGLSGEGKWNRTGGDAKTQPLCISAKLNLKHKILGEVEKKSFIALLGKGNTVGQCPQNCVPQVREDLMKSFIAMVQG